MSDEAHGNPCVVRFALDAQVQKRRRLDFEVGTGAPQTQNECTTPTWCVLGAVACPMLAHIVELLGETMLPKRFVGADATVQEPVARSRVQVAQTLMSLCRSSAQLLLQHAVFVAREELMPSVAWLMDAACWERRQERAYNRLMQWNLIVDEARRVVRTRWDTPVPLSHCGFQDSFDRSVATAVLVRMRVL